MPTETLELRRADLLQGITYPRPMSLSIYTRHRLRKYYKSKYLSNTTEYAWPKCYYSIIPQTELQGIVYAMWRVLQSQDHWITLNLTRNSLFSLDKFQLLSYDLPPQYQSHLTVSRAYVPFPNSFGIDSILITSHTAKQFGKTVRLIDLYSFIQCKEMLIHRKEMKIPKLALEILPPFVVDLSLPINIITFQKPSAVKILRMDEYKFSKSIMGFSFWYDAYYFQYELQMKNDDELVALPVKTKKKYVSREVANQRVYNIMNGNISQRQTTSYDGQGIPQKFVNNYKYKQPKDRRAVQQSKNLTSRQKMALKCTKKKSITLIEPRLSIGVSCHYTCNNVYWDWETANSNYMTHAQFISLALVEYERMGIQYDRLTPVKDGEFYSDKQSDAVLKYLHSYAALCLGFKLTYFWNDKDGHKTTYVVPLVNKAHFKMFKCFNIPIFEYVAKAVKNYKFMNYITKSWSVISGHPTQHLRHSRNSRPHDFNCLGNVDRMELQGAFSNGFKSILLYIAKRFAYDTIKDNFRTLKQVIVDMFTEIRTKLCEVASWCLDRLNDLGQFIITCATGFFDAFVTFTTDSGSRLMKQFRMLFGLNDDYIQKGCSADTESSVDEESVDFSADLPSDMTGQGFEPVSYLPVVSVFASQVACLISGASIKDPGSWAIDFFKNVGSASRGAELTANFTKSMTNLVWFKITGNHLFDSELLAHRVHELAKEVIEHERAVFASQRYGVVPQHIVARLNSIHADLKEISIRMMSKQRTGSRTVADGIALVIEETMQKCILLQAQSHSRIYPINIFLHGPSKQGKTTICKSLPVHIMQVFRQHCASAGVEDPYAGVKPEASVKYFDCGHEEKHFEGYANQFTAVLEEIYSSTNEEVNAFWSTSFQSFLDVKPVSLTMAFEGKGKTFFTSPIVICTSNAVGHVLATVEPEAYHRRMDFDLNMESDFVAGSLPHYRSNLELTTDGKVIHKNPRLRNHEMFAEFKLDSDKPFNYVQLVNMCAKLLFQRVTKNSIVDIPDFDDIVAKVQPARIVKFGFGSPVSTSTSQHRSAPKGHRGGAQVRARRPSSSTVARGDKSFLISRPNKQTVVNLEYPSYDDSSSEDDDKTKDKGKQKDGTTDDIGAGVGLDGAVLQGRIYYHTTDDLYYVDVHHESEDAPLLHLDVDPDTLTKDVVMVDPEDVPANVELIRHLKMDMAIAEDGPDFIDTVKGLVDSFSDHFRDKQTYDTLIIQQADGVPVSAKLTGSAGLDTRMSPEDLGQKYQAYFQDGRIIVHSWGGIWNRVSMYWKSWTGGTPLMDTIMFDRSSSYTTHEKELRYSWWPTNWLPESLTPYRHSYGSNYDKRLTRSHGERAFPYTYAHSLAPHNGHITREICHGKLLGKTMSHIPYSPYLIIDLLMSDPECRAYLAKHDGRINYAAAAHLMFGSCEPNLTPGQLQSNESRFGIVHSIAWFLLRSDQEGKAVEYYDEAAAKAAMKRIKELVVPQQEYDRPLIAVILAQGYLLATNWLVTYKYYDKEQLAVRCVPFYRKLVSSSLGRYLVDACECKTEFLSNVADEYHRKFSVNLAVGAVTSALCVLAVSMIFKSVMTKTAMVDLQSADGQPGYEKNAQDRTDVSSVGKHQKYMARKAAFAQRMIGRMQGQARMYEPVLDQIQSSQYIIFQESLGMGLRMVAHCAVAFDNVVCFNKHVWEYLQPQFTLFPVQARRKFFGVDKASCIVRYAPEGRDLVYVTVPNVLFGKNILKKHAPLKSDVVKYRSSTSALVLLDCGDYDDDTEESTYGWEPISPIAFSKVPHTFHFGTKSISFNEYLQGHRSGNRVGDCFLVVASKMGNNWMWMGGHFAGSPSSGSVAFVPVYRDDYDKIREAMTLGEMCLHCIDVGAPDPLGAYDADDMFNATTPVLTVATNTTGFIPTPFQDENFPIENPKGPAHIDNKAYKLATENRDVVCNDVRYIHPFAIQRIRESGASLMDDYTQMTRIPDEMKNCRMLEPEEAVYGNGDHVASCDFTTSNGIRLKLLDLKKEFLADKEHPHSKKILEVLWLYLNYFKSGFFTYAIAAECLKDELRDWARVHAYKTRIFYVLDFVDCMMQKCAIGDFMCRLKQYLGATDGSCGVAAGRAYWKMLHTKFKDSPFGIVNGDIKHNDYIMHLFTLYVFVPWTWRFYPAACAPGFMRNFISWAFIANFMCIRFNRGKGWMMGGGNPSGGYITTHMNTIYNSLLHRLCFEWACRKRGITTYREEWAFFVKEFYSDDNLSASLKFDWWTLGELAENAKLLFGVTMTDADKGFNFGPNLPISKISYLSRAFYPNPKCPSLIHAPLKLDSLLPQLFWVRKAKGGEKSLAHVYDQLQLNLNNVSMELLEYPRSESDPIALAITDFIKLKSLPLTFEYFSEGERLERTFLNNSF